ncbi:MAG: hypothetical protein QOF62_1899 [Pyrinomonadaceae bacterium]|jgi:hypothetical protein|nr:hypothetical protein [Pyrinomonadaceae bacterium]
MRRIHMLSFCLLFAATGACKTSTTTQSPANTSGTSETSAAQSSPGQITSTGSPSAPQVAAAVKPKVDACALLDSKEIQTVQGEAVKETKLSGQAGGGLQISQCFFTLPTFSNSISLLVAQKGDGADAKDPRDFWRETFQKGSAGEKERERERDKKDRDKDKKAGGRSEEEEDEGAPPQKVAGVGDDAYWIGSRVGGALYVLKGNSYLRISIGGAGDQTNKINKSKTLAQKAIARL